MAFPPGVVIAILNRATESSPSRWQIPLPHVACPPGRWSTSRLRRSPCRTPRNRV